MNNRNCPNCGSPFSLEVNKCPYCGTLYFDMTAIDLEYGTPVFLKLRTPFGVITQKCIPRLENIEFKTDTTEVKDVYGNLVTKYTSGHEMTTDIKFHGIPMEGGINYKVETKDE